MPEIPFVDLKTEDRVLRNLIVSKTDNEKRIKIIKKNINYSCNNQIIKDIFYSTFKQWLFSEVFSNFIKYSEPTTEEMLLESIKREITDKSKLEKRKAILERILNRDFEEFNFKKLINKVREKFNYRMLFDQNKSLHEELKDDYTNDVERSAQLARKFQDTLNKVLLSNNKIRILEEDIHQNIEKDIEEMQKRRENPELYKGISTGFKKIDQATGGWIKGELSIVLGRPGSGKSVLLLNFGVNAFKERNNIIYVTIEMPLEQQKRRYFSMLTKINYNKIKMPENMKDVEFDHVKKILRKQVGKYNNYFRFVDAPSNCTTNFIENTVYSFEANTSQKVDLIIVDPLYLMQPSDRKTDDKVGQISWDLKILARNLNVPIVAASQFNRESHKRHKAGQGMDTMDAAFSDKLSNNADNMMGISEGDGVYTRLSFPKTRDSNIESISLERRFENMLFIESEYVPEEKKKKPEQLKDKPEDDEDY